MRRASPRVHDVSVRPVTSSRDEVGGVDRKDTPFAVEIPHDFLRIYLMLKIEEGNMTSKETEQAIRALGLAVTKVDGKWRINYRGGKEATAYYTTDDDDAMGMATAMVVARGQQ
jgi:hypothetical protein